jgi:hypothetical protein
LKRPRDKRSKRKSMRRKLPSKLSWRPRLRRKDLNWRLRMMLSRSSRKSKTTRASSPRTMTALKMKTRKNPRKMMTMAIQRSIETS